MTDIEDLRENVINAARWHRHAANDQSFEAMAEAIDALDAALTPDPWALLEETLDYTKNSLRKELERRIREALDWRDANP